MAVQGHGSRAFATPILEAYEKIERPTPVYLFFDFQYLVEYEPPLRTELVLHLFPDRPRIRGTYVLIGSHPKGTMMAAAVNAFRGTVDILEDRQRFESLLDERLSHEGGRNFSSSSLRAFVAGGGDLAPR